MERNLQIAVTSIFLLNWLVVPVAAQQRGVAEVIKSGVEYIQRLQKEDGSWDGGKITAFDITPLCTLALFLSLIHI